MLSYAVAWAVCYKGCLAGLERNRNRKQFTQLILEYLSLLIVIVFIPKREMEGGRSYQ